ncbi:MAG TPA: helix-turn-helix transcriptional regulator [Edaphocola sp.]|nr:helix-turn-helix transcriptional regulator [Edaphocola sp.]
MNIKNINVSDIGQRIKKFRNAQGLTQQEVAQKLRIEVRNYAKIERGERKILDVLLILEIAFLLDADLMELLIGEEKRAALQTDKTKSYSLEQSFPGKQTDELVISIISELEAIIHDIDQKQRQLQKDFNKILADNNHT